MGLNRTDGSGTRAQLLGLVGADSRVVLFRRNFGAMTGRVVDVGLAGFFVAGAFMRTVAVRKIRRKAAHANPDRLVLRWDLQGALIRSDDTSHRLAK